MHFDEKKNEVDNLGLRIDEVMNNMRLLKDEKLAFSTILKEKTNQFNYLKTKHDFL